MFTVNSSIRLLAALAVATLCSPAVEARGNPEAGATKAAVCTACHGPNGNSVNPEWPSLAGQSAAYITEQLTIFRAGHRNNAVMWPMAIALTDEDIADLAAYFSRQTPNGLEADAATYKAGEALYRGGDRSRNIPSCKACHGPAGLGAMSAAYPALRAQHSVYTVKQLLDYQNEQRYRNVNTGEPTKSRHGHMMTTIAKRLTEEDIRNLASYIQGLR